MYFIFPMDFSSTVGLSIDRESNVGKEFTKVTNNAEKGKEVYIPVDWKWGD